VAVGQPGYAGDRAANADQAAAAQALFDQGRALLEQGLAAEACPKFAESQRLDPGIGTMLWLADCYDGAGQTASAWATFKEAAAAAALRKDPRVKVALDRAAQIEPKLSLLKILLPPEATVQGIQVWRDGILVESAQLGLPVPLDPGIHTIKVGAPNRKPWSTSVDLVDGTLAITIPLLEQREHAAEAMTPPPNAPTPIPAAEEHETLPSTPHGMGTQRIAGLTAGAVGVVGLVVGSIFGITAKSTYDQSNGNGHCVNNMCDATGKKDRSDANSLATVSTVVMVVGAVGVACGGILYLTAPQGRPISFGASLALGGARLEIGTSW